MLQPERRIEIIINGQRSATFATTLAVLVVEQALAPVTVATALNGHFVPVARRATTPLTAGDRVEIVSARQGG